MASKAEPIKIGGPIDENRVSFNDGAERIKKVVSTALSLLGFSLIGLGSYYLLAHLYEVGSVLAGTGLIACVLGLKYLKDSFSETYTILRKRLDLSKIKPIGLAHPNKQYCYDELTQSQVKENIEFYKIKLNKRSRIKDSPVFNNKMKTTQRAGSFNYDKSSLKEEHWTANFADKHLFGYAYSSLLAQDELQVLEHPGLYHLKNAINGKEGYLDADEAALIKGVERRGRLDKIYGNDFAKKTQKEIKRNLTVYKNPDKSNIFAIAAPKVITPGTPYKKEDLEELFYRANTAFRGIKDQANGKKIVCHTGNWGAGAFGGSAKAAFLCQLAAAEEANIDELLFYPMSKSDEFKSAKMLYDKIKKENPKMTADEFLTHLAKNAVEYGLSWGCGSGT